MNIAVIVAHPDDEVLGAGGAIVRHVAKGDRVSVLILGSGLSSRLANPQEMDQRDLAALRRHAEQASAILGVTDLRLLDFPDNRFDGVDLLDIVKAIEAVIGDVQPGIVYTHHPGDLNIDHQRTAMAVLTACRPLPASSVQRILAMEVPSATGWGDPALPFVPNVFLDITHVIAKKLEAMSIYHGELRDFPHARSLESLEARAKAWGSQVGVKAAEPFVLLREILS
jgi:LmbE family N-acetylglucosaminyl deacetylase